jgi:uncharacterized protein (TIGR02246 family)
MTTNTRTFSLVNFVVPALVGFAVMTLAGCTQAPPPALAIDVAAEETKIRDIETAWNKDWAAKDADKIASHYADDATLMAPGGPAMKGIASIHEGLKPFMADPNMALSFAAQHVEIAKSGDVAFTQGTYTMTMSDAKTKKPTTEKGNYVTVYKKMANGNWMALEDINTPDGTH